MSAEELKARRCDSEVNVRQRLADGGLRIKGTAEVVCWRGKVAFRLGWARYMFSVRLFA